MVMNRDRCCSLARFLASCGLVLGCAWGAEQGKVLEKSDSAPKPPPSSFESFEQPEALASWHVLHGGEVTQSQIQAKDGNHAAQWTFVAGSRLQVRPCTAFANLDQPQRGRLKLWIYNPQPVRDVLTVRIGEGAELAAGQARSVFTFGLDFSGWRSSWSPDARRAGHPASPSAISAGDLQPLETEKHHRYRCDWHLDQALRGTLP